MDFGVVLTKYMSVSLLMMFFNNLMNNPHHIN